MSPNRPRRPIHHMTRMRLGLTALIAVTGAGAGLAVSGASASSTRTLAYAAQTRSAAGSPLSARRQEKVLDAAYTRIAHDPRWSLESKDVVDYGIGRLWRDGIDGAGTTVAVVGEWNSPAVARMLALADRKYGLPTPQITTIYPSGTHRLPSRCPSEMLKLGSYGSCRSWGSELALDVSAIHMMAPYAKIIVSVTPADSEITEDDAEQVAAPEIMQGIEAISRHRRANVISSSDGSGEVTYSDGRDEVTAQDPGELAAAAAGIPFVNGTGDCGAAQALATAPAQCLKISRRRDTATWDDSPWTLAVGGSIPHGTTARTGSARMPLVPHGLPFAPAAGFSSIFTRPNYQRGVAAVTHSPMRSVPDITMDDSDGTSEAGPLMAGVLALATQANGGHDLGPVSTALYDVLGPRGAADGISDVTHGNNSVTSLGRDGHFHVRGFSAHKGFDVATGWGTIYAPRFVPALVRATRASHDEAAARARAAAALTVLRDAMTLSPTAVTGTATSQLSATGFLPRFPVTLSVAGRRLATLHADDHGDIIASIDPAQLHLSPGTHTVTLASMLITVTGHLTTR